MSVTIKVVDYVHPGRVFIPPGGSVIYCHQQDEQRVRDALTVVQEQPQWRENMTPLLRTALDDAL